MNDELNSPPVRRKNRKRQITTVAIGLVLLWLAAAYVVIPFAWQRYIKRHPAFDDNPRITETSDGHPGDPLNVALFGTDAQLVAIMEAAQWHPAAALGLESDLKIARPTSRAVSTHAESTVRVDSLKPSVPNGVTANPS